MVTVLIDAPQITRFIGSSITILTCILYFVKLCKRPREEITFPHKLIIHICSASMLYCTFQIIGCLQFENYTLNCFRFFFRINGLLGQFIWPILTMHFLTKCIIHYDRMDQYEVSKLNKIYLCFGYLVPSLLVLLPIFTGEVVVQNGRVWTKSLLQIIIVFEIPFSIFFLFECIFIFKLYLYVKNNYQYRVKFITRRLILFPLIILFTYLDALIFVILENLNRFPVWFYALDSLMISLTGFINVLFFGHLKLFDLRLLITEDNQQFIIKKSVESSQCE